jgi:hypothetical protein
MSNAKCSWTFSTGISMSLMKINLQYPLGDPVTPKEGLIRAAVEERRW